MTKAGAISLLKATGTRQGRTKWGLKDQAFHSVTPHKKFQSLSQISWGINH